MLRNHPFADICPAYTLLSFHLPFKCVYSIIAIGSVFIQLSSVLFPIGLGLCLQSLPLYRDGSGLKTQDSKRTDAQIPGTHVNAEWVCLQFQKTSTHDTMEGRDRIPGASWLVRLVILVSSGFNWETMPQRINARVTEKEFQHQPWASACITEWTYKLWHMHIHIKRTKSFL